MEQLRIIGPQLQGLWQKTLESGQKLKQALTPQTFPESVSPSSARPTNDPIPDISLPDFGTHLRITEGMTPKCEDGVPSPRVHEAIQAVPSTDASAYGLVIAHTSSAQDSHAEKMLDIPRNLLRNSSAQTNDGPPTYSDAATQTEQSSLMTAQTDCSSPRTAQTSCSADSRSKDNCSASLNHGLKAPSVDGAEVDTSVESPMLGSYENGEDKNNPEIFDGRSQVVVAQHNERSCLAILVTREMIENMNHIIELSRKLELVDPKYEEADRNVNYTRHAVEYLERLIESADSQEEIDEHRKDIEQRQSTLFRDDERREALQDQVISLRRNLNCYQDSAQGILKEALNDAGLLNAPVEYGDDEEDAAQEDNDRNQPRASRTGSIYSELSHISMDKLARYAAHEEVRERYAELLEEEHKFENRQQKYEYEKGRFQQRLLEDPDWRMSQTEFDLILLEEEQELSRNLSLAEDAYEEALAREKKFGPNQWEQESGFVTDDGDGYQDDAYDLSREVDGSASAPTDFIYGWMEDIPGVAALLDIAKLDMGAGQEFREDQEDIDLCDIQSAGLSDARSCLDMTRNRRRIDRWRAMTGRDK
ncbi:MAG: hypothetical protein Q9166_000103 [cf. Caloplaca sp. 2 TL-2023]